METDETYEDALKRELKEELNLDLNQVACHFLGYLKPQTHAVSAFMKVYEIRMEKTPAYNQDDFVEYFWLTPDELLQLIKDGEKSKDDLPKLVQYFYTSEK